ncbi:Caspase-2 [Frankliniella fusca]|uniref:Caspase-2 n=1 Tax=Frankliniella fusca TaxID=407009 RepID=A0AAE1HZ01_9NEOP|nr:Caspase-2 [Frankliniella fusca]
MEESHRQLIKDNINVLVENCNADNMIEFLKYRNIFTERELHTYASVSFRRKPEEERCRQIFTDIQTRGPNAFSVLLECLHATKQDTQYKLLRQGRVAVPSLQYDINVKKSQSFPQNQNVYRMKSYPKGYFIFINNIKFETAEERIGAEKDVIFLEVLRDMGFSGDDCHFNKTVEEMWDLLKKFACREDLAEVDSCVVLISSHGNIHTSDSSDRNIHEHNLYIDGVNDITRQKPLFCNDIIELFNSDSCKLQRGCPKIFIFQACRGERSVYRGAIGGPELVNLKQSHPIWRDTFLLAPSMEGFKANRDLVTGSWLFMALTQVFPDHAHNKDLETMKDLINKQFDRYAEETKYAYQQTLSYYEYGVSKKLYFNPGLYDSRDDAN